MAGGAHYGPMGWRRRTPWAAPASERRWSGLAGVVAGVAGLGVADLAAWLIAPTAAVVPAVGQLIIEALPAVLVNWGKETLGFADKPVLLAIVTLGMLALCGLAGVLEYRRPYRGVAVLLLLASIGAAAVAVSPGVPNRGVLPVLVGFLASWVLLQACVAQLQSWQARRQPGGSQVGAASVARREFLRFTVAAGVLATAAAVAGRVASQAAGAVAGARARLTLPAPAAPAPAVPAGADLGIKNLTPYLTANDDFYRIDTALKVPVIEPDAWTLRVTGMVEQEVSITLAELLARPLVEHYATLTCVSNAVGGSLAGNARWLGYPIRALLAEARPRRGAEMVLSTSHDGWTAGTPLSALTDPRRQALLAVGMNGEPLPLEHGFPVRMVVPGLYGYVSATKWVVELKVTTFAQDVGYWTPLGWAALGPIKIAARIDTPRSHSVRTGTVVVAGVAWAQHSGISRVEVRVDDGDWQPAQLADTVGPDTWRQWRFDWAATPGKHTLAVRATDSAGRVQTGDAAPPEPDGATGWHTIEVEVG